MAKKLWDKGSQTNELVHAFTVGNDPELDAEIVEWDAVASAAHAKMLGKIGLLSTSEVTSLVAELKNIYDASLKGEFEIPYELEDCHTAIESALVEKLGETGKKIHTGRSRNDQVLVAMRLYLKAQIIQQNSELSALASTFAARAAELGDIPMPGYTHYQPAMPSSVAMWLHAFAESSLALVREGLQLLESIDSNPLGAASGFGVPLPLDREMTTELLGFARVQRSPIEVQNSRGRYELKYCRWLEDIASVLEKLACDLILYSTEEYGFFSIPEDYTTGSSIMPQKKNPDVIELLRARASKARAASEELSWVTAKLPSNYHRDLQYTKEPVIRSSVNISEMLSITIAVIEKLSVNTQALEAAMSPELFATYDAFRRVAAGASFRDAYRETAEVVAQKKIDVPSLRSDAEVIYKSLQEYQKNCTLEITAAAKEVEAQHSALEAVIAAVFA